MSLKLDANGNIRPEYLEKELQAALEHDLKYQQTDNMKKRAIKTAQSYDEFKNMVACAHLKTLSRQEIDSLKDIKKGWQKKPESSQEPSILQNEISTTPTSTTLSTAFKPPKNAMTFERDWRRLRSNEEKTRYCYQSFEVLILPSYLMKVGLKKTIKALQHDCNAELLEEIITVLLPTSSHEEASSPANNIKWLRVITEFDRFALNVRFFDRDLLKRVTRYLVDANELDIAEKYEVFEK